MLRRLPVLLALMILLVAVPWKALRLLPRLLHTAQTPSELFQRPQQHEQYAQLRQALQDTRAARRQLQALQLTERLTSEFPNEPDALFEAALTAAAFGTPEQSLVQLSQAVMKGFSDESRLDSARELDSIRQRSEFQHAQSQIREAALQRAARMNTVTPTRIQGTTALVTDRNTRWEPERFTLTSEFNVAPVDSSGDSIASLLDTEAARLVNAWIREGSAAGFHGILYDNRDRGHSTLERAQWPELVFVRYSPEIRAAGGDFGFRPWQRFNLPTFGNASTALVNPVYWRSNPRAMLGNRLHAILMLEHYLSNQLYCAPEHNDFDTPHGDVYPANAPCWLISQGSSGSDQPFLRAIALTLAAFPPETRRKLERDGLLMHAVQWILRQSLKNVSSAEDFLSGRAHPTVFREEQLDPERMVQRAHAMAVDRIPPLVRLKVIQESAARHGVDYFSGGPTEELLTHPLLIARIHRTVARKRTIVVQAAATPAPQPGSGFRWVVLQGDPTGVDIQPLNPDSSVVAITFTWQPSHPVRSAPELSCSRVDVGVFTEAGGVPSMPAMICSLTIPSETRLYDGDRLVSVDYAAPEASKIYCDPFLVPVRKWKDTYRYDSKGTVSGWVRTTTGQQPQSFNADGDAVASPEDSTAAANPVQYRLLETPEQRAELIWTPR
ncbi:MAG: hypothetical protein ACKO2P_18930 [Planctomycetota bacterium]